MPTVAGIDFGTLSVRVALIDAQKGRLATATSEYPLHRKREDPDHATQSHERHMQALVEAMRSAIAGANLTGREIEAIAIDTTGSSVIPVDRNLRPIDDYYLWCDHRAWREAALITETAHRLKLPVIDWCGGTYSSEWGWSKLLHWLRHNPDKRDKAATALEHCDMAAATLCGITDPSKVIRSACAMGHKWLWNKELGGYPSNDFLTAVDPLLDGWRDKLDSPIETSDQLAGHLCEAWAERLNLRPGIPVPVGAFDAHWDALGAGAALGDVVNITGTSTCIVAMSDRPNLIPGLCGVVPGSVDPGFTGIEAGMSATGDVFDAIARRAGQTPAALSQGLEHYKPGQTGLLRFPWDNGDRTVLVNPEVSGITLGWRLTHTAQDELFAAIEGAAFHCRIILEHMERYGTPILRVVNAGGIPQRNHVLNQVYANVLDKPVLVPAEDVTSLGSGIFAFLAAGTYKTVRQAQQALCPAYRTFTPNPASRAVYDELYGHFRGIYFAPNEVLPAIRRIAALARSTEAHA